jgi:NADH-quinone oxidoreductase subunit B
VRVRYQVTGRPEVHVADLGLACCAAEFSSAITRGLLEPASGEPAITVLVVSGTATTMLSDVVDRAWADLPEPKALLAFGACTISGGPYWDSPSVVPGIDEHLPVASYVPGCPPDPQALVSGILDLADRPVPA